jgi:hypothetical protein
VRERLTAISATPAQIDAALKINAESRTRSLKLGFMCLTLIALLALVPCQWLPNYRPGEIPTSAQTAAADKPDRARA